jgi:hypothetical protein
MRDTDVQAASPSNSGHRVHRAAAKNRHRSRRAAIRPRRLAWLVPILAVLASLALSYGAYQLAGYSWDQVVSYESPYTGIGGQVQAATAAPVQRTVVVLIDGLRDDASRLMPSISALRARGADVRLTIGQPSLSYPSWTAALTGAPQQISGVTTNWFEGPVAVETLFDSAAKAGRTIVVTGPDDLDAMFGVSAITPHVALTPWSETEYTSGWLVDETLRLDAEAGGADFVFVLLPDVDQAGHDFGGESDEYEATVANVDADLARLIDGLDDGATTFVVLPDHGHIATGGHGGWEDPVIHTFAAFAGPGVAHVSTDAELMDVAPTVAMLAGLPAPRQALGTAIDAVLENPDTDARAAEAERASAVTRDYIATVLPDAASPDGEGAIPASQLAAQREAADAERLEAERAQRLPVFIGIIAAVAALAVAIAVMSWRALIAALFGSAVAVAIYNGLFFLAHGLHWSLSAFNEEDLIQAFFNQRMLEAAIAALVGCLVAAVVYAGLRRELRGPQSGYHAGWLALGSATVLLAQAALVVQAGVFIWQWGPSVSWVLPDFRAAFKYDLDLIQLTALGAAALIGPVLTAIVGWLHPRARRFARSA